MLLWLCSLLCKLFYTYLSKVPLTAAQLAQPCRNVPPRRSTWICDHEYHKLDKPYCRAGFTESERRVHDGKQEVHIRRKALFNVCPLIARLRDSLRLVGSPFEAPFEKHVGALIAGR